MLNIAHNALKSHFKTGKSNGFNPLILLPLTGAIFEMELNFVLILAVSRFINDMCLTNKFQTFYRLSYYKDIKNENLLSVTDYKIYY